MVSRSDEICFWVLALICTAGYSIMIAGAKNISEAGIGVVYLAIPNLLCKSAAVLWFDKISYDVRCVVVAVTMSASFLLVSLGNNLAVQLTGVALSSFQTALGEASMLAMGSLYGGRRALSSWSSGSACSGVFGYAWIVGLTTGAKLSFSTTIMLANILVVLWVVIYFFILDRTPLQGIHQKPLPEVTVKNPISLQDKNQYEIGMNEMKNTELANSNSTAQVEPAKPPVQFTNSMKERVKIVFSLWRHTVPLLITYFSSYLLASGIWSAIGFPVTSKNSRISFYRYANWINRFGVFVTRSSGNWIRFENKWLWCFSWAQVIIVIFFIIMAIDHYWYDYGLLSICFLVGFLNGFVYVNSFININDAIEDRDAREMALTSASTADTLGIALASALSIIVQDCLYEANNIEGSGACS